MFVCGHVFPNKSSNRNSENKFLDGKSFFLAKKRSVFLVRKNKMEKQKEKDGTKKEIEKKRLVKRNEQR